MIRGFLLGVALIVCVFIAYLIQHLGFFLPVTITEGVRPDYYVLFQKHVGSYYKISEVISAVESAVRKAGMGCPQTFGQYFDDPKEVDEDRLQSRGGCISNFPFAQVPATTETDMISAQKYVVATFAGSPAIGPWKVYPAVENYVEAHRISKNGPTIEIYTINGDKIETEYLFPVK